MRMKGGVPITPRDYPIAASQTLHKGDFLKWSSGKVTKLIAPSGSANTAVLIASGAICMGLAAQGIIVDSNSVSTDGRAVTTVPVAPSEHTEHMLGCYNATPSSGRPADLTLGVNYELANVTGSAATIWTWVGATSTTNANLYYIGYSEESASTESLGYGWFQLLRASTNGV